MIIGFVLIVIGIMITTTGIITFLIIQTSDDENVVFEIGDFLAYDANMTDPQGKYYGIWHDTYTVIGIAEHSITWNLTMDFQSPSGDHHFYYNELTIPKGNVTLLDLNLNSPTSGLSISYEGEATVQTKWGGLECSKFNVTSSYLNESVWVKDGQAIKDIWSSDGWISESLLVGTNVEEITSS